jgi:hypothetical protein
MHTKSKMVLTLVAGVPLGAAAVQGLHAEAKPKAYLVSESEILDRAALESYSSGLGSAMQAAGGHFIGGGTGPTEKIIFVLGDPPKRIREPGQSAGLAEVIGPQRTGPATHQGDQTHSAIHLRVEIAPAF